MNYAHESLASRKYLSLEQAMDSFGITAPELKRAIALGSVRAVDIGNTSFVEHFSLKEYLEKEKDAAGGSVSSGTRSTFYSNKHSLDEDNHSNQKEREVFQRALERDSETASQLATAPYATIALLILFAFTLALPISQTVHSEKMTSAQAFFANAKLKEVTTDKVETLLTRAHTVQRGVVETVEERVVPDERRDYFAGYQEQQSANVLTAWLGSISEGIDALALRVYEMVEAATGRFQ